VGTQLLLRSNSPILLKRRFYLGPPFCFALAHAEAIEPFAASRRLPFKRTVASIGNIKCRCNFGEFRTVKKTTLAIALVLASALASPSLAQNIMGPTQIISVTSTIPGGSSTYTLPQIADGVTSDASPFNGFQGQNGATGTISFTLDKAYDLDAAHLWNDINVRAEGVNGYSFRFFDASNALISTSASFATTPGQVAAHVTGLGLVPGVKRVELVINSVLAQANTFAQRVEIREVAFNGKPTELAVSMPGNHFGCYRVAESRPLRPETLQIRDQFGRAEVVLGRPVMVCNPSIKVHNDRTFGVTNPERHLICYDIARQNDQQRSRRVQTNNQMAPAQLTTNERQMYCVPSSKRLIGEREMPVEASRD
jgi:hypothetical protein